MQPRDHGCQTPCALRRWFARSFAALRRLGKQRTYQHERHCDRWFVHDDYRDQDLGCLTALNAHAAASSADASQSVDHLLHQTGAENHPSCFHPTFVGMTRCHRAMADAMRSCTFQPCGTQKWAASAAEDVLHALSLLRVLEMHGDQNVARFEPALIALGFQLGNSGLDALLEMASRPK